MNPEQLRELADKIEKIIKYWSCFNPPRVRKKITLVNCNKISL